MEGLQEIYGPEFFREWGPANRDYVLSAGLVADAVYRVFRPRSLADLGCGCGIYSHLFREKGLKVLSIDGVTPPREHSYPVEIVNRDLTLPISNEWGRFDLALCLEVAEHIPEEHSETFLRNLMGFSDRLLISAAPPGQGGHHHVNEQPRRYWADRLARLGYAYNRKASGLIMKAVEDCPPPNLWMVCHIGVYDRATDPKQLSHGLPFSVRA
ncbi:MAG: class I SAM-dependent methyltransferase [Elusimicrobia bacterium]|nr:class I SAM-dependent methyltransferase [Elusimicrobiota bacterium]